MVIEILFIGFYTPHKSLHTLKSYKITFLFSTEEEEDEELPVIKPESEEHVVENNQEAMQDNGNFILQYFITELLHKRHVMLMMYLCFVEHPKELTEEEKQQVVHSEDFLTFFDRSARLVERTLAEDLDIFFDYSGRDMEDREGSGHFSLNKKFHQCTVYMRQIHSFANTFLAPHAEEAYCTVYSNYNSHCVHFNRSADIEKEKKADSYLNVFTYNTATLLGTPVLQLNLLAIFINLSSGAFLYIISDCNLCVTIPSLPPIERNHHRITTMQI